MGYQSLLFCDSTWDSKHPSRDINRFSDDMIKDLNLDQLIHSVVIGNYRDFVTEVLKTPLTCTKDIYYRQEIFQELEEKELYQALKSFVKTMDHVDSQLISLSRLVYEEQKESYFLYIMYEYCNAVDAFYQTLRKRELKSQGFQMVLQCVQSYVKSEEYSILHQKSQQLMERVKRVKYHINFDGYTVKISPTTDATDYMKELLSLFHDFLSDRKRKGHCRKLQNDINMNTVEFGILECVKKMNPELFHEIQEFMQQHFSFRELTIEKFRQEAQFYIDYIEYIQTFRSLGSSFTYPQIVETIQETKIIDGYDIVLQQKMFLQKKQAIDNDFDCRQGERVFVVTGPNQGGKTTYSRMIGQIHYLTLLGVPVPATKACVIRTSAIFTHFEHEEVAYNDNGKLQDDLLRMRSIFDHIKDNSLIIMNEMLSSTSYQDAIEIGEKIICKLQKMKCISIYVTFVDEFSRDNDEIVSLVSVVDHAKSEHRTFKIARRATDGLVYAKSLADKYDLSYERIKQRLSQKG